MWVQVPPGAHWVKKVRRVGRVVKALVSKTDGCKPSQVRVLYPPQSTHSLMDRVSSFRN